MSSSTLNYDDISSSIALEKFENLDARKKEIFRGAIYTRSEVANFILDLVGYNETIPLYKKRLLEPSFGGGEFLLAAIKRLLISWKCFSKSPSPKYDLKDSIVGIELDKETFYSTKSKITLFLLNEGLDFETIDFLVNRWLRVEDFLMYESDRKFQFVVGNPPYIRQELIDRQSLLIYRSRYKTMHDKADIYIPFIENSLNLLSDNGILGFICSDRWMKNRYGAPLRKFISKKFYLKIYVDMVDTPAFAKDVCAYPAITVISKEKAQSATRVAHKPVIDEPNLSQLAKQLKAQKLLKDETDVKELFGVVNDSEPWLLDSADQVALLRRLEGEYPLIEDAGCKVGIGVATGADKVFIGNFDSLDVEEDRKLPLVMTKDIISGEVAWQGLGVINPFNDTKGLVNLDNYPRLGRYLENHRHVIASRHCAQKIPSNWYRTIDRIYPALSRKPKLLIPDIKGKSHIVYEDGKLYPHHNLYYIISDEWDLRSLQAVLLSKISKLFITTYSIKMRGGFMRFQAQYLRRIRLPFWSTVDESLRIQLHQAATLRDIEACDRAVFQLYKLTNKEIAALGGNGD